MKEVVSKYLWLFVEMIVSIYSILMIVFLYNSIDFVSGGVVQNLEQTLVSEGVKVDYDVNHVVDKNFRITETILELNSFFDWKEHVDVIESMGNDLTNYVVAIGNVNTSIAGSYKMSFVLNWNGQCIMKDVEFYVNE